MGRKLVSTAVLLLSLLLVLGTAPAFGKRLIVRFSAPPLASHPSYAKLRSKNWASMNSEDAVALTAIKDTISLQHEKFISSIPKGWSVSKLFTERGYQPSIFNTLVNAIAINVPDNEVKYAKRILRRFSDIVSVSEVKYYKPKLHTSRGAINAFDAWEALGATSKDAGKGIKIAVLDTGIYTPNPMFSDAGMEYPTEGGYPLGEVENCNKKVIASRFYFDAPNEMPEYDNHSYPSRDAGYHGIHCASTAGGSFVESDYNGFKANISGVAPGAWLMNYRIFHIDSEEGEEVSVSDEQVALALANAAEDGADVISNSWGSFSLYSEGTIVDITIRVLVNLGVSIVFAAGNEGPDDLTVERYYPALRVGATTSGKHIIHKMVSNPPVGDEEFIEYTLANGTDNFFGTYKLYAPDESNYLGCEPFDVTFEKSDNVAIVVKRGTCIFDEKIANAYTAGAQLIIIVETENDASTLYPDDHRLPTVCIGAEFDYIINMSRTEGAVTATFKGLDLDDNEKDE